MANEINGTDLYVFMDGAVIAHATGHTLSPKMATRKTSNKDSGLFETNASGRLAITASCDGLMVYGDINVLRAAFIARVPVTLDFGEQIAGALDDSKIYASGEFLFTGLDEGAPDDGNATYNASFEHSSGFQYVSDGALTVRIAHSNCTTHNGTEGVAFAMPNGGTAPYTYLWDDPAPAQTTQACTAMTAGTYTVVVTDSTGGTALTATATVIISEPAA